MSAAAPRVLLVEDALDFAAALKESLVAMGAAMEAVTDVEGAAGAVGRAVFDVVIVGPIAGGTAAERIARAADLRARAAPTPVGLIVGGGGAGGDADLEAREARGRGFAFVLARPFAFDKLLGCVADALHLKLAPSHPEVRLIERYFAALGARDWDALVALCTPDVVYHLPAPGPFGRMIVGREAFGAYAREVFAHFPDATFEDVTVYELGPGQVARFRGSFRGPGGEPQIQTGAVAFRIEGGAIARIGVELDHEKLAPFARRDDDASNLSALLQQRVDQVAARARLTRRERELLDLLLIGRGRAEIGLALGITARTVKFHQANLLAKLGADSRADLIRLLL